MYVCMYVCMHVCMYVVVLHIVIMCPLAGKNGSADCLEVINK